MERKTKRRGILLTAAAIILAAVLAATGAYAFARYTTVFSDFIEGELALFDVTSEMAYKDQWGEAEANGTDLGTMRRGNKTTGTIEFTFTAYNHGDVPVTCYLTIDEGFKFSAVTTGNAGISDDGKTLTINDRMEPEGTEGDTVTVAFTVTTDGSSYVVGKTDTDANGTAVSGVYSRNMYITAHYEQAE